MRNLDYRWTQARRYVEAVETFIARSDASLPLTETDRARLRETPESELELGFSYEDYVEATDVFPDVLRRSTFVMVLTFLETDLNDLCLRLQRYFGSVFSVYDLQGRGIERAADYILGVADVNVRESEHWKVIQEFRHIRDVLVHSNGAIRPEQLNQPAARIAGAHPLIELEVYEPPAAPSRYGVVLVKKGLCEEVLDIAEAFLKECIAKLPKQLRAALRDAT